MSFLLGVAGQKYVFESIPGFVGEIFKKTPDLNVHYGTAKIDGIRAFLFYDHAGNFSADVLAQKDITLWNTIIGEGFAGSPSNSTLALIQIVGRDVSFDAKAKVNIVVNDLHGKVIMNVNRSFSLYGKNTKTYIPIIIPDTGCGPVTISATLKGVGLNTSSMSQTIPFDCGE